MSDTEALTELADRLATPEAHVIWSGDPDFRCKCACCTAAAILRALPALIEAGDEVARWYQRHLNLTPHTVNVWNEARAEVLREGQ